MFRTSQKLIVLLLFSCLLVLSAQAVSTADHSKFPELQKDFKTGPEVTQACLSCHTEAAKQMMATSHWTWRTTQGPDKKEVGKAKHIINNFCIALESNEPRCTSCHVGYGWKDKTFDFTDETLVDCLICHDQTKTYKKFPVDAGHPNYVPKEWPKKSGKIRPAVNLKKVAQNVGKPTRHTCGSCHFYGGGGEGVKHGDMDDSLNMPGHKLDVHMDAEGADFDCIQCHTTKDHKIEGRLYSLPAVEEREHVMPGTKGNLLACESCHDAAPHKSAKLNDHTDKVSCQACHIPKMAREKPTKMWWDWSTAGHKTPEGKPLVKKVALENDKDTKVLSYHMKKGNFIWAKNNTPEYAWFNGNVDYTYIGDKIDDKTPGTEAGVIGGEFDKLDLSKPVVQINTLKGDYNDENSRIWPVKVHRGKQAYDTETKMLLIPKLFGKKGTGSYWTTYDWNSAFTKGMEYVGLDYSGKYDWIQTEMYWPLSHMVAPEEDALSCTECHAANARLANLAGFYLPGRDANTGLDRLGLVLIALTLVASLLHGFLRLVIKK